MIYNFFIGVGVIIFLIIVWTVLIKSVGDISTIAKNITLESNKTYGSGNHTDYQDVIDQYDVAYNAMYFSLLFFSIIIFIWIIKQAVKAQRVGGMIEG